MPGRQYNNNQYRYGFNGQEMDNEVSGVGNITSAFDWEYSTRLGKRWNIDPKFMAYPEQSSYACFNGNPNFFKDPSGQSGEPVIIGDKIVVSSHLIFYGSKATADIAKASANEIQTMYNDASAMVVVGGKEYRVEFNITFEVVSQEKAADMASHNTSVKNNFIKVEDTKFSYDPSSKDRSEFALGGNSGYFVTTDNLGKSTTAAHEWGHGVTLDHTGNSRGNGQPGIMAARGTQVDNQFQRDPSAKPGAKGGTIDPSKRKVLQSEIQTMFKSAKFNSKGIGKIGSIDNSIYYNKSDKSTPVEYDPGTTPAVSTGVK